MTEEVFYSILIRAALMGLQLVFGAIFIGVVFVWTGKKAYDTKLVFVLSFALAFGFSLCFFFIRFLGGY